MIIQRDAFDNRAGLDKTDLKMRYPAREFSQQRLGEPRERVYAGPDRAAPRTQRFYPTSSLRVSTFLYPVRPRNPYLTQSRLKILPHIGGEKSPNKRHFSAVSPVCHPSKVVSAARFHSGQHKEPISYSWLPPTPDPLSYGVYTPSLNARALQRPRRNSLPPY